MSDQAALSNCTLIRKNRLSNLSRPVLQGKITQLKKADSSELFSLNNINKELSFTSVAGKASGNKTFSELAAIGDSFCSSVLHPFRICHSGR
jgi:hypothetical protein